MADKVKCPWCGEEVSLVEGIYHTSYDKVRERRCSKCKNLISTRFEGTPEEIARKDIREKAAEYEREMERRGKA